MSSIKQSKCKHINTVFTQVGSMFTVYGEATDNLNSFQECLDCGMIYDGSNWKHKEKQKSDKIPY